MNLNAGAKMSQAKELVVNGDHNDSTNERLQLGFGEEEIEVLVVKNFMICLLGLTT